MFENFSPTTMLAIKKYAYWLWLLLALSMPTGWPRTARIRPSGHFPW